MNNPLTAVVAALAGNNAGFLHRINRALYSSFGKTYFYSDLNGGAVGIADHAIENHAGPVTVLFGQSGENHLYLFFLSLI